MAGRYVKITPEMAEQAVCEIDWARIDAMTDEDIARQVTENPDAAPIMTRAEIRAARVRHARRRSGLTQEGFAARYRIPLGTLRDWEQGRREPDAAALAYLRVIEREPEAVERALAAAPPLSAA
jgi:putative transcriptional regulator